MTRIQKAFCCFLCLCFFGVLAVLPEPFSRWENVYRQFPLYCFLEKKEKQAAWEGDEKTVGLLIQANGEYLGLLAEAENQPAAEPGVTAGPVETAAPTAAAEPAAAAEPTVTAAPTAAASPTAAAGPTIQPPLSLSPSPEAEPSLEAEDTRAASALVPRPEIDLSPERLADYDYLLSNFFVVDENTDASAGQLNAAEFLAKDMTIKQEASAPQILIYHSHSQEAFADSREGEPEDTVTGVGNYLAALLTEKYGYHVLHVTEAFDIINGEIDRSRAYDCARTYVGRVLEENPSVEVVIDLHRDGVPEDRHLVTEIDGKQAAQIMFYNGLSYTVSQGPVEYLPNPYIQENLAFSFQLEYETARYYPGLTRCIYLAGLRYNLDLRPKAILLEAGAQTNTVQEVKNAMEPFADILNRVLKGSDKQG